MHCNTNKPQPEHPLGRTQSRSHSISTSSNKQSNSQPKHELTTVEPEPTIKHTPFDRSAVTPQGPPAKLDDPPTVQPIHRSRSRSASLGRTIRQLFPQEEPPVVEPQAPVIEPSRLPRTHPTPLVIPRNRLFNMSAQQSSSNQTPVNPSPSVQDLINLIQANQQTLNRQLDANQEAMARRFEQFEASVNERIDAANVN